MAVRRQRQQQVLSQQAGAAAAAAMAHSLAQEINNPLQCLTTVVYMASEGLIADSAKTLAMP